MTLSVKADAVTTLEWALDQFTAVERSVARCGGALPAGAHE